MTKVNIFQGQKEDEEIKTAVELLPLVYQELRQLATRKLAYEAPDPNLQPTVLVHEAWLRLAGKKNPSFANREHFLAAAAETMRRILIDRARQKRAVRHGGGQERVALSPLLWQRDISAVNSHCPFAFEISL